jgi:hypothetical protein
MLGTVLDASGASSPRFIREIVLLVRAGFRARAEQTAQAGAGRLLADGLCLAAVWLMTLFLASDVGNRIRGPLPGYPWAPLPVPSLALLGLALALALVGLDRLAGLSALGFIATILGGAADYDLTNTDALPLLVPAACFVALVLAPRRRRLDMRRASWLMLTAALAAASSTSDDTTAFLFVIALFALVPTSLLVIRTNPRPALACAVCATYFGIRIAQDDTGPGLIGGAFIVATPLVFAFVLTRTRLVQARLVR